MGPTSNDTFELIETRCGVLRLACWHVGAEEASLIGPKIGDDAGAWLDASGVRDRVVSLGRQWLEDKQPEPAELEPGCWAFGVLQKRSRRVTGVIVGVTWSPTAFDQAWFRDACGSAGVDADAVKRALAGYTWPGRVDIALLTSAFPAIVDDAGRSQADHVALDQFSEKLSDTYEETGLLFRLARLMNGLEDPRELIPTCCNQILPVFPFKWIAVRFWARQSPVAGLTDRLFVAGELPCEQAEFDRVVVEQFSGKTEGDWTRLLETGQGGIAGLVGSEVIVETITHDGEVVGAMLAGNKQNDCPVEVEVNSGELLFFEAASNLIGVFHENIARFGELKEMFTGTLRALTASIDAKDPYTRGHSERVAYLGKKLAEAMGLDPATVERIHTTGLVHDVGKIGVPERVLRKAGRLTDEEFENIKQHPQIGYDILKGIPSIEKVLPGVLHHHERFDGRGYPYGLAGEDIPLPGRILALADTFDAMSSTRSYRPAMPRDKVLAEIRKCAGTQFDPELAPLFVELDFSEYDRMVEKHKSLSVFAA